MAFFDEELRNLSKRTVPASVSGCLKQDKLSQALWQWAQNLENYGRIILLVLVICGCITTISTGMSTYDGLRYDDNRGMATFLAAAVTALQWAFYAFLEYCVYHALSLLMGALASIVQSNKITSDLALYHANRSSTSHSNIEYFPREQNRNSNTGIEYGSGKTVKTNGEEKTHPNIQYELSFSKNLQGITEIDDCAFMQMECEKNLIIPNTITCIGSFAFMGCTNIQSVEIPFSVKSIGYKAFDSCSELCLVKLPRQVKFTQKDGSLNGHFEDAFSNCCPDIKIEWI